MKQPMLLLLVFVLTISSNIYAQDRRAIKAAEITFSAAQKDYKKGDYKEAAQKYEIVVNSIPANIDSRKHVEMRLDALIDLVDIRFNKSVNIKQACEYTEMYRTTMNTIRNSGLLRASALVNYLRQEQEYATKHASQCESYNRVGGDMDKFKNTFDKVFEEE